MELDTFESADSVLDAVASSKRTKLSKRIAKEGRPLDAEVHVKSQPIAPVQTQEEVEAGVASATLEGRVRYVDEISPEFLPAFGESVGGITRDLFNAAAREEASKRVDPSWDVGTVREQFRSNYGMEFWDALEGTRNKEDFELLKRNLDEKAQRDEVMGKSLSGTLAGSLFDPIGILSGGTVLKGAVTAARAYKLSKNAALAGGALTEGGLYAGAEAYSQTSQVGEVYDDAAVAQTFAIAGALHFGIGKLSTNADTFAPRETPPRAEPFVGTPDEVLEASAKTEADAMIARARADIADEMQRTAEALGNGTFKAGRLPNVAEEVLPETAYPLPKVEGESAMADAGSALNADRATLQDDNIIKSASEGVQDWQDLYTRDESAIRRLVGDKPFDWLETAHGKASAFLSNTLRGLSSKSPVVRAVALTLGEDSTGMFAAGRKATAVDKSRYNNIMRDQYSAVHDEYRAWAKREGKGGWTSHLTTKAEENFNKLLRDEMEARWNTRHLSADEQASLDAARWANASPEVKRAADALDAGNQKALNLMKEHDVLGAEGLSDISRGYVPRRMNGKMLQDLQRTNPAMYTQIESALGRRFFESFTAQQKALIAAGEKDVKLITPEKSATIAQGLMQRAINRASGMDGSTIGLMDRAARDEIRSILQSKDMAYEDIEHTFKLMDKRLGNKSGSNRLKGRMEVDLATPIQMTVHGKPTEFRLLDLYDNDMNRLMYSYAEEMSGRIALARQGISTDNDFEQILNVVKNENKSANVAEDIQLLRDMYSQLLGRPLQGQGENKAIQFLTQLNPLQSLGQVGWAQGTESSLSVARLGVGAALKAIPILAKVVVGARKGLLSADDARLLKDVEAFNGPVGEQWRTHRPSTDVMERLNSDGQIAHMADRLLKAGQHINGYVSFMHQIMESQLKATAVLSTRQFAKEAIKGDLTKRVADAGFNEQSLAAVKRQLEAHAEFRNGELFDLKANAWTDRHALEEFMRNIERLSGQLVQRDFAGETASWMHKDMGRLLLSLRGYSVKAFNKQLTRNLNIRDAVAAQSVVLGLAFSTLGYTAKMHAMSAFREDREEFLEERLSGHALIQGAVGYMALGSFGPELLRPLASWYSEGQGEAGAIRSSGNAIVAAIPGLAPLERATTVAGDIGSSVLGGDKWSARKTRHLVQFFLGNSAPVALAVNASVDDDE